MHSSVDTWHLVDRLADLRAEIAKLQTEPPSDTVCDLRGCEPQNRRYGHLGKDISALL
jgi:hypothetical protein